ncbi:alpha/beta hydrolase family protein [Adhaeribacter rhizoryzae]|uniref:Prolyl oligopeptidase family serine peptidase n=1 Tax=Adhaeribacter rhizoryzae TaxID=2607907 RepID=A0A5M6D299_9BACT|nr:prolyl oligopeptidase family serine peptidase [Adhaeribacter rhizoryzae]KAA5541637.1 prolyl oligopeptidase family serine peptidase [Adhaeribacter rhizoryzae]
MKQKTARMPRLYLICLSAFFTFLGAACSNEHKPEQNAAETSATIEEKPGKPGTAAPDSATATETVSPARKEVARMPEYTTSRKYVSFSAQSLQAWQKAIPEIQNIKVTSTKDGKQEPALFFNSGSAEKKPLLVVLHSWSDEYLQQASIPFCLWAKKYDWVFIQPNYRGIFQTPEAMGSELAIQDIVDAVNYAKKNANVDASRVYVTGASGGGMGSLLAVSHHPEIWAGVAAWVPVVDILDWYKYNAKFPSRKYRKQIVAAAGGDPTQSEKAAEETKKRSPIAHLSQKINVPIYIAHGIKDILVPPDHALRAFNLLANEDDRFTEEQINYILKNQAVPPSLKSSNAETYFGPADPKVHLVRESGNVKLVLFEGVHDLVYNPTLLWLNEQQKR